MRRHYYSQLTNDDESLKSSAQAPEQPELSYRGITQTLLLELVLASEPQQGYYD